MADTTILKTLILAFSATLCHAMFNDPSIFRPCNLRDVPCIQNSLRSQGRSLPPRGVAPATLSVPRSHFDAPSFNSSYDDVNMVIRGLDRCFVSEYYVNRRTNSRLLSLDCPWLTFESDRIMYQHYLRREDGIFRYKINGSYPLLTFTLPMKGDPCQNYANAYVHALPIFNISPFDRPTSNHLTHDLAALGVFEQETFAARAQFLTQTIINNKLCNFGCK